MLILAPRASKLVCQAMFAQQVSNK